MEAALEDVKQTIAGPSVLAFPDYTVDFVLDGDAFRCDLGAVIGNKRTSLHAKLEQTGKPVAFASRLLSKCEKNYSITELECLAVSWALQRFRPSIHQKRVVIRSDHAALRDLLVKGHTINKRLEAFRHLIRQYDTVIEYSPGNTVTVADALSRAPAPGPEANLAMNLFSIVASPNFDSVVKRGQKTDPTLLTIYNEVNSGILAKGNKAYIIYNGILCRQMRGHTLLVIPPGQLRNEIVEKAHLPGHRSIANTMFIIRQF